MMRTTIGLTLFFLVCAQGCSPSPPAPRKEPSGKALELLLVAENDQLPFDTRFEALDELGKLKDPNTIDRLLDQVPGNQDLLTAKVLATIEDIGDPSAIQRLESIDQDPSLNLRGRIRTAL